MTLDSPIVSEQCFRVSRDRESNPRPSPLRPTASPLDHPSQKGAAKWLSDANEGLPTPNLFVSVFRDVVEGEDASAGTGEKQKKKFFFPKWASIFIFAASFVCPPTTSKFVLNFSQSGRRFPLLNGAARKLSAKRPLSRPQFPVGCNAFSYSRGGYSKKYADVVNFFVPVQY